MRAAVLAEPILVGREHELTQLQQFLDSATAGKGLTVFVSGEAGSGKTRLTHEFLSSAKEKGFTVLSGWCLSNAAVPYFPFVEAFESLVSSNDNETSVNSQNLGLKTGLMFSDEQGVSAQTWRDQKFASVTKELLFLSTDKPLILFIDDLHWADSASLALLHYIARGITAERILILSTFRSEELPSANEGVANPLTDMLRLMKREDLYCDVKLEKLNPSNIRQISESMLCAKVHDDLVRKLDEESQGNPLFIIETLKLLYENGDLIQDNELWTLVTDKVSIPIKVKDIILRRLSILKINQRRTLDVASVIGDKFDAQLLSSVLNVDSLEVLETLNAIVHSKSLITVEGDYYRFDHAKTREVLYEDISLPLKKGYHQRIAERLESFSTNQKQRPAADLAYHYAQAGNKPKSIQYHLAAGMDALSRFSNVEAINAFTYVLENLSDDSEEKAAALEGLGEAYQASMKFKDATKCFEALASMGGTRKILGLRKAMEATFFQNDIPHLAELIENVEKCNIADKLEKARLLMNKGRVSVMTGDVVAGTNYFEDALRIFESEYSLWDTAWTLIALGSNASRAGKIQLAAVAALRAISIFNELGDTRWLVEAYNMAGMTFIVDFGLAQEGLSMLQKAEQLSEDAKLRDYLKLAQINAESSWALSSLRESKASLSKDLTALKHAEKTDSDWGKGMAYANLTIDYTVLGEVSNAEKYYEKLMSLPPACLQNPMVNAQLSKAMFLAGKKQWEPCLQIFDCLFARLKSGTNPGFEAIVRSCYGWVLLKQRHPLKALAQIRQAQKFYKNMAQKFAQVNLQTSIMVPRVAAEGNFEARLDLVNISRSKAKLVRIENQSLSDVSIESVSPQYAIQHSSVELDKVLEPFSVIMVKLYFKAKKASPFNIILKTIYKDGSGDNKTEIKSMVTQASVTGDYQPKAELSIADCKIEFKSENAQATFDFLVNSFREDYKNIRMPEERSGWRTFMDIVRTGRVSKYSVYGSMSGRGQAITELERMGIIEIRVFSGERGRGGEVLKVRIASSKESVKQYIKV